MKIPYFCCIGAELKRYAKDFDFMNQVYLYKVPTDDSIDEVLSEDYFKPISDSVLQDDIVYIYEASSETLHSCRFDKQNGHITAVPLASDETLTGAVTTIIHDNLTKNRAVISNADGKVAVSDVTTTELSYLSGATSNIQEQLNNKANAYSYASNCITEIPQDIKLELNNGTLTLKSGSKVYVPNGAVITTSADKTTTSASNGKKLVFLNNTGSTLVIGTLDNCVSGSTDTKTGIAFHFWFDTTNNIIHQYGSDGTTETLQATLPIAIITVSGGAISSIDQVFNGFGYIGSTIFALPGVKGLAPNGRNADGTLKNMAVAIINVQTSTISGSGTFSFRLWNNNISAGVMIYNESDNYNYINSVAPTNIRQNVAFGKIICTTGGVISSFSPATTFHAVDYNDTEFIAHQAMPSDAYNNLTLAATGNSYIAPADGYFTVNKNSGGADERISMQNITAHLFVDAFSTATDEAIQCYIPASKGDSVTVVYSLSGTTQFFRFVYANGSK